ncbi:hypothetical protein DL93DRAFT_717974 [Clavulina sp. PMI_390]|nr:hypothetical protein DL93DRAFT_717974 [Clavulina sp. PMI_390]
MTDLNQSGPVDPSPLVQEMRRLPDKDQWDWNQQHDIREFVHFLLSAIAPQLTRPDAPVVLSSAPCTDCVRELNIPRPLCERFMPTIQGAPSSGSIQQLVDDWQREGSWETTPAVTSDATCSHGQPNLNFGTLNNVPLGVSRFGQFLPIAISRNLGNVRDYGQVILNPTIRLQVPERGEQVWALRAVSVSHANPFDLTSTLAGHWTSAVKYQNGWYHYDDRSREMIPNLNDATVLLHSVVSQNVGLVLYELVNTPNCALHSATSSHHAHIPAPSSLPTPAVSSSSSRPYRPSAQTLPSSTVVQPVSQSPHNEHAHDDDTVSFEDSERYLSDAIKSQGGGDDDSQLQDSLRDEDDIFGDGKENRLAAALKTWKIRCSTEIEFARMRDQLLNEAKTASERLAVLNRIRTSGMRDKIDPAIPVLIDQLPGGPELLADLETDPFGLKPERHSRILEPVNETTASPLAQDFYLRGAEMTRAQFEKILDDHVKQHPVNADLVSGTRELLTDKEMGDKIIILYVGMSRRGTYQRHKEDRDQAGRPTGRRYFTYLLPDIEAIAHFRLYRIRGLDRNFPQGPTFTGNIEEYLIDAVGPASLNVAHGGRSSGKFSPDHMPPKVKEVTDQVQTTYRVSTPKRNSDDVQPRVQKFNTLVDTLAEHYKNQPGSKPIKEETLEKIKSLGSLIGTFSDEWGSGVCLGKDLTEAELDNKSHIFDENAGDGPQYVTCPRLLPPVY